MDMVDRVLVVVAIIGVGFFNLATSMAVSKDLEEKIVVLEHKVTCLELKD